MENFPSKKNNSLKNIKLKHQQYQQSNSEDLNGKITKQSTTATIEIGSTTCGALGLNTNNDEGPVDIHLASGEEDISNYESDILLQHTVLKDSKSNQSANGTTFL